MSKQIKLTTTGSLGVVVIPDLSGVTFTHPVVDFDLLTTFDVEKVSASEDLIALVAAGHVVLTNELAVVIPSSSIGALATSHAALSDLDADDHPRYYNTDGTAPILADLDFGGFTAINVGSPLPGTTTGVPSTQIPDQANAEGVSIHKARADHIHQILAAVPTTIGGTNIEGTSNAFSRADHVHAHGPQVGGTSHNLATTLLAGFLDSADKIKLNALSGSNTGDQTNITGNAATADAALGLQTTTTVVDVSASAAPSIGQALIATSPSTATWQTLPGGGDALTANPLSQFAATTSVQLAGVLTDETGTGVFVLSNSPVLITPDLGTPTLLVGTNITGTAPSLTAGTVTTNADLTGVVTSIGNATSIGTGAITNGMLANTALANVTGTNTGDNAPNPAANTYADGKVTQTITDGVLTTAPSEDAVFDALALKATLASPAFTGTVTGVTALKNATTEVSTLSAAAPIAGQVLTAVTGTSASWQAVPTDPALTAHIGTVTGNPHAVTATDLGLGNVDNTSDADKPVSTAQGAADTATLNSANAYADGLVVGLWDDRGDYDASVNTFPAAGGSGTAGAVLKGDIWRISVAGTLGGTAVDPNDTVRALVDSPAQVASNWSVSTASLGYTPVIANSAITPGTFTKITYDSKGLVTAGAAATTADIDDSTNRRYVTDAELIIIGNTTGSNTGDVANTAITTNPLSQFAATTSAQLAGVLTDETGTGTVVFNNSPTLITPDLGTPSTLVGTNITGTASGLTAGTVVTNANLTGEVTSIGNATTVTNAAVLGKVLTGFSGLAGTLTAADNILQAFNKLSGNIDAKASLASPTLTGIPTGPTAAVNTNTTQLATTAFVLGQASNTLPVMSGTAIVGVSFRYARQDHVHPSDTSRAPLASPAFTGTVTGVSALKNTTTEVSTLGATAPSVGQALIATSSTTASWQTIPGGGDALTANPLSQFAATTSAQLASVLSDETGTGLAVFSASPALTGIPTGPTAAPGTSTTQLATTAFASAGINLKADIASPALTGTPTAPTAGPGTNSTQIATTAYADAGLLLKANIASPSFTGIPLAPTAPINTNTTQIATTAFVLAQKTILTPLANGTAAIGADTRFAAGDHIHPSDTTKAGLVSPAFTGIPTGPTAAVNTNTTQLATTAFVLGQAADTLPVIAGSPLIGSSFRYARQDHKHPTDTTRAPIASPAFTGTVTGVTALKNATTEVSTLVSSAPTVGQTLVATSSTTATWQTPSGGGGGAFSTVMYVRDERISGTAGGSSIKNVHQTRILNTVVSNTIVGASLSSNRITLPAGTYRVWTEAPAYRSDAHRVRLRNITDNVTVALGTNADSSSNMQTGSSIAGLPFIVVGTKLFEVQHYMNDSRGGDGLGRKIDNGDSEIYTTVMLIKDQ